MSEPTYYTVMRSLIERESAERAGKMISASGRYVQRASAFKRAKAVAHAWPECRITVWEYQAPGNSKHHVVQEGQ